MRPTSRSSNPKINQSNSEISIEENSKSSKNPLKKSSKNLTETTGKKLSERTVTIEESKEFFQELGNKQTEKDKFKAFNKEKPIKNLEKCGKKALSFAENLKPTNYNPILGFINNLQGPNGKNVDSTQEKILDPLLEQAQGALQAFEKFERNQKKFIENFAKLLSQIDASDFKGDEEKQKKINKQLFALHQFLEVAESINKKLSEGKGLTAEEIITFAEKAEGALKILGEVFQENEESIEELTNTLSQMKSGLKQLNDSLSPEKKLELNDILSQINSNLHEGTFNAIKRSIAPIIPLVALIAAYLFLISLVVASALAGPFVTLAITMLLMAALIGSTVYGVELIELIPKLSEQAQEHGQKLTENLKAIKTITGNLPEDWHKPETKSINIGNNQIKNKNLGKLFDFIQEKKELADNAIKEKDNQAILEKQALIELEEEVKQLDQNIQQAKKDGIDLSNLDTAIANEWINAVQDTFDNNRNEYTNKLGEVKNNIANTNQILEEIILKEQDEQEIKKPLNNILQDITQRQKQLPKEVQGLVDLFKKQAKQILEVSKNHKLSLINHEETINEIANNYKQFLDLIGKEATTYDMILFFESTEQKFNAIMRELEKQKEPNEINLENDKEDK